MDSSGRVIYVGSRSTTLNKDIRDSSSFVDDGLVIEKKVALSSATAVKLVCHPHPLSYFTSVEF